MLFFLSAKSSLLQASPFEVGEKLEYTLTWGEIPAGFTVMEITERVKSDGKDAYHIVSSTRSNKFVSSFYKVNSVIDSYVDILKINTLKVQITEHTGRRKRHQIMLFDPGKGAVRISSNGAESVHKVPSDVYDSVSVIYYLRTQELSPGKQIRVNTFSNAKLYDVTIDVLKRETLTIDSKSFDTIKVHSLIMDNALFKSKGETFIWLTDDEQKVPVRIQTRIQAGSINATLTKITR